MTQTFKPFRIYWLDEKDQHRDGIAVAHVNGYYSVKVGSSFVAVSDQTKLCALAL